MIRAIVIDDEKPSREVLCNYLREYCNEVQVIASASSVKTGAKAIKRYIPDVVFLDIELADGQGFDILNMLDNIQLRVIFVTAYSEHAIRAFRVNAIDYLLKPVKIDELQAAVARVRDNLNNNSSQTAQLVSLIKDLTAGSLHPQPITINHLKGFDVIKTEDIVMCRADGFCTVFHLVSKKKITGSKNLKHYEELLPATSFMRVHHSYIINLQYVQSYSRQGLILLTGGINASLGDSYKNDFVRRFMNR